MKPINVFIPAAGFAERLKPISTHITKPLLPVMGRPVLDRLLEKISALPVSRIGINAHHKWESVSDYIAKSPYSQKITLFHEEKILGTGGALMNAASLLEETTFLVHNADILSQIDLAALLKCHLASGNIATLAVHDYPLINNVRIDGTGRVRHVGKHVAAPATGLRAVTYTGIAAYSPGFLRFLAEGRSEVVGSWLAAISSGRTVGTLDVTGTPWSDIGTPGAYAEAVFRSLAEEGEMSYVHPSVECDGAVVGSGTVVEKGCLFEGTARLRKCILLPGSLIADGENIENTIAGPGFRVPISEPPSKLHPSAQVAAGLLSGPFEKVSLTLIGAGGSDRRYYRVSGGGKTAVLLESPRTDPDYERQIVYTRFFSQYSVPVPALMADEREAAVHTSSGEDGKVHALFEDLGDLSLYSWARYIRNPERLEDLYRKTLDILVSLHTVVTDNARACPPPGFRIFDYDHLRWETDYFMERFVHATAGILTEERALLDEDFDRLARKVDSFPKSVLHRDFQSQNIMVTEQDRPRLIDYQGARTGPPGYDVASLLWDPYVRLDDEMRARLIAYYVDGIKCYYGSAFDEEAFRATLLPCRLQRHMQALGAYGFLAGEKGKRYFLKHVPLALAYLHEETESAEREYPVLGRLARRLL